MIRYLLLADKTWGDLLGDVLQQPQRYLFWVIIFLLLLFILSRLNNFLEVKGVDRAIYVTRGMVGTIMYFLIAPIIFFIMLNIIAMIYGVPTINVSFLGKWIGLTFSSYWWLLKCFFGNKEISDHPELYNVHSIIRILWVLIPITLIWLRMAKSRVGKLVLLPLIIGVLVVARHKGADETFITKDMNPQVMRRIPVVNWFVDDPRSQHERVKETESKLSSTQRKILAGILVFLTIAGLVVGLYLEYRIVGLVIVMIGVLGFLLMAPTNKGPDIPDHIEEHYNINLDSLITRMDSIYRVDSASVEVYDLSLQINAAYHAIHHTGAIVDNKGNFIEFPDSLCRNYKEYFYDWCE